MPASSTTPGVVDERIAGLVAGSDAVSEVGRRPAGDGHRFLLAVVSDLLRRRDAAAVAVGDAGCGGHRADSFGEGVRVARAQPQDGHGEDAAGAVRADRFDAFLPLERGHDRSGAGELASGVVGAGAQEQVDEPDQLDGPTQVVRERAEHLGDAVELSGSRGRDELLAEPGEGGAALVTDGIQIKCGRGGAGHVLQRRRRRSLGGIPEPFAQVLDVDLRGHELHSDGGAGGRRCASRPRAAG